MKILHLLPYLPTPAKFGGALRIYHILNHLEKNHDVTVCGFNESGDLELFRQEFPRLEGRMHFLKRRRSQYHRLMQLYALLTPHSHWYNWAQSAELERRINRLLANSEFDFVLSEFATMGHFNLETDAIRILDAHNVEYDNFRRMSLLNWSPLRKKFYTREYEKCYKEEVGIFNKQDAIFTTSSRDGDLIREDAPDIPQFVIPNGVDIDYFQKGEVEAEPYSMVFTGAMSYVPNCDGMIYFIEKIFPRIKKAIPQAKIYVVGSNPPPILKKYSSDSIVITGFVDDVRPWVDRASVYVVPLNMGSGTRLKVVEALSMKKPIVSTSIGCEGIEVNNEEHLLIRDNPDSFAEAVIKLMENRKKQEELIYHGYERVRQKYDWRVIGNSIDNAFRALTQESDLPRETQSA